MKPLFGSRTTPVGWNYWLEYGYSDYDSIIFSPLSRSLSFYLELVLYLWDLIDFTSHSRVLQLDDTVVKAKRLGIWHPSLCPLYFFSFYIRFPLSSAIALKSVSIKYPPFPFVSIYTMNVHIFVLPWMTYSLSSPPNPYSFVIQMPYILLVTVNCVLVLEILQTFPAGLWNWYIK